MQVVFLVDKSGFVEDVQVFSLTSAAFEKSATEAVTQWKFSPGLNNKNEAVSCRMMFPVLFQVRH